MRISTPIAVAQMANHGCAAKQAAKMGTEHFPRLSFQSLLPAANRYERFGALASIERSPLILRGRSSDAPVSDRRPDQNPDSWRGDGRMLMAWYSNHMLNVMPSQKILKSKAFSA